MLVRRRCALFGGAPPGVALQVRRLFLPLEFCLEAGGFLLVPGKLALQLQDLKFMSVPLLFVLLREGLYLAMLLFDLLERLLLARLQCLYLPFGFLEPAEQVLIFLVVQSDDPALRLVRSTLQILNCEADSTFTLLVAVIFLIFGGLIILLLLGEQVVVVCAARAPVLGEESPLVGECLLLLLLLLWLLYECRDLTGACVVRGDGVEVSDRIAEALILFQLQVVLARRLGRLDILRGLLRVAGGLLRGEKAAETLLGEMALRRKLLLEEILNLDVSGDRHIRAAFEEQLVHNYVFLFVRAGSLVTLPETHHHKPL